MHAIYNTISKVSDKKVGKKAGGESGVDIEENKSDVLIVTQNKNKEVMQIIYFDFDNFTLSEVSKNQLAVFTPDETKHPANRRAEIKILN